MKRGDRPKIRFIVLALVCAGLCIPRIVSVWRNTKKLDFYKREIPRLAKENRQLESTIDQINNNPQAVERIVRDTYGFMKPGEYVFRLRKHGNVPH